MTGPANQFHQTPSHLLSPPLSETEEKQANTGFLYFLARKRQVGEREGRRKREREGGREKGRRFKLTSMKAKFLSMFICTARTGFPGAEIRFDLTIFSLK